MQTGGGIVRSAYRLTSRSTGWPTRLRREPASGPKYQMTTRAVAFGVSIFWHYLDFLWVVLFTLLLTWRR